jgi:hypothetical protein
MKISLQAEKIKIAENRYKYLFYCFRQLIRVDPLDEIGQISYCCGSNIFLSFYCEKCLMSRNNHIGKTH